MAHKKRKHHKVGAKHHTRRHRVSGVRHHVRARRRRKVGASKVHEALLTGLGVVGGAVLTPFLINGVQTMVGTQALGTLPSWMIPGGAALTGGTVMVVAEKYPLARGFGAGMLAVGTVEAANEIGLNEPGIAGLAMKNNSPSIPGVSRAVAGGRISGPSAYMNQTVGAAKRSRRAMAIGALVSN